MPGTRRHFFQQTAAIATGLAAAAGPAAAQTAAPEIRIPKVKLGKLEISRLILGVNPFYGYSHNTGALSAAMREFYTPEKVVEVLQRAQNAGMTAFNYVHVTRAQSDWEKYRAAGGTMHLIAQATTDDPAELVRAVKPEAVWVQGERTDDAYRAKKMETIRDYCKKLRDLGVSMVGVGSHIPEVLAIVEDAGWDIDFYAGSVYNRRRTPEEFRALLGGELPEMPNDIYLQDDPPRMYKFFQQTAKPCCAFKILAAGRVRSPEAAFRLAFQSIKPQDFVCVGMFPRTRDEVTENARFAARYGEAS